MILLTLLPLFTRPERVFFKIKIPHLPAGHSFWRLTVFLLVPALQEKAVNQAANNAACKGHQPEHPELL